MKKINFIVLSIFLAFACEDSTVKTETSGAPELKNGTGTSREDFSTAATELIRNTGKYHNAVLATVEEGMAGNPGRNNPCYIADITLKDLTITYNFEFDSLQRLYQIDRLNELLANDGALFQKVALDSVIDYWVRTISRDERISGHERELLSKLPGIYNMPEDMDEILAYDSIYIKADVLIMEYESIPWEPGQGEAVGGFLYIARSSAEYWKNRAVESGRAVNGRVKKPCPLCWIRRWGAPQFDAAGYIVGWGKSWLWDEEESAKKRIGAGLSLAVEMSGFTAIGKDKGLEAVVPCDDPR